MRKACTGLAMSKVTGGPLGQSLGGARVEGRKRATALHLAVVVIRVVQRCVGGGDDLTLEARVRPAQVEEHHRLRPAAALAGFVCIPGGVCLAWKMGSCP